MSLNKVFWVVLACFGVVYGQNADCDDYYFIDDTLVISPLIEGYGYEKEYEKNASKELSDAFDEEKNSIWYHVLMPFSGEFTFDITTTDDRDDWDFLLYEKKPKFCKRIKAGVISPVRSNLSRSPITGLGEAGDATHVKVGVGNPYSLPIQVEAGQEYILVVNNPKRSGSSHQINLHFPKEKKIEKVVPVKEVEKILLKIEVKDKEAHKPIAAEITVNGIQKEPIIKKNSATFEKELTPKFYKTGISVNKKGYLLLFIEKNIRTSKKKYVINAELSPIKVGSKINLPAITFHGDKATFLPSAYGALEALENFMRLNPGVKVLIGGHVNGRKKINVKEYKTLSYERAKAVLEYLKGKGIPEDSLLCLGYGNGEMLYKNPKNALQRKMNRRVEVKILEVSEE